MITPCIAKCKIDRQARNCEGCGRSIEEIQKWSKMTDEEKMSIMKRLGYGKRKGGRVSKISQLNVT